MIGKNNKKAFLFGSKKRGENSQSDFSQNHQKQKNPMILSTDNDQSEHFNVIDHNRPKRRNVPVRGYLPETRTIVQPRTSIRKTITMTLQEMRERLINNRPAGSSAIIEPI